LNLIMTVTSVGAAFTAIAGEMKMPKRINASAKAFDFTPNLSKAVFVVVIQ